MLEKEQKYTEVNLSDDGSVSLRLTTTVTENGVVISRSHHRHIRKQGDSLDDLPTNISASISQFWNS